MLLETIDFIEGWADRIQDSSFDFSRHKNLKSLSLKLCGQMNNLKLPGCPNLLQDVDLSFNTEESGCIFSTKLIFSQVVQEHSLISSFPASILKTSSIIKK